MGRFQIMRLGVFATLILLSFIVIGVEGGLITLRVPTPGLAIATAVLTILVLGSILAIDFFRKNSPTSWVMFELPVLGVLTILWLASSGLATSRLIFWTGSLIGALKAFTWLGWLIITGYTVTLMALSFIQNSRGNVGIWRTSVSDYDFFAPMGEKPQIPGAPMQTYPQTQYPQQQYPQQQHPQQQYTQTPPPQTYPQQPQQFTPQHTGQQPTGQPYPGQGFVSQPTGPTGPGGYPVGAQV